MQYLLILETWSEHWQNVLAAKQVYYKLSIMFVLILG